MSTQYKLASNTWDSLEEQAIKRVQESQQYTMGKEVDLFENEFASYLGMKHAIMVNSGSSANLIACAAFKYSSNHKNGTFIVPAVSWSTTFFPIHQMGYQLKFVDISPDTLNIDIELIEKNITSDVVGVCGVSLLGNPTGMDKIKSLCKKHNLFFFEDNCESFGASINGKLAGSFGDITSHSFFFSHHLQTMEGGMVCTDNDEYAMLARSLRAHGWTRDKKSGNLSSNSIDQFHHSFEFVLPGYCVRPIEFMAAAGQAQLSKWPKMKAQRILNAEKFQSVVAKYPEIIKTQITDAETISTWFGFPIILIGRAKGKRSVLTKIFDEFHIEYRPIVAGNFTRQSVMRLLDHHPLESYPIADTVHFDGIFVGNDSKNLDQEISLLDSALRNFQTLISDT